MDKWVLNELACSMSTLRWEVMRRLLVVQDAKREGPLPQKDAMVQRMCAVACPEDSC